MEINNGTKSLVKILDYINTFIDKSEPWLKDGKELSDIISKLYSYVYRVNILLSPILVKSTESFFNSLGLEKLNLNDLNKDLTGINLVKLDNLFERKK
jgi:methionyl-tRNA synthetase